MTQIRENGFYVFSKIKIRRCYYTDVDHHFALILKHAASGRMTLIREYLVDVHASLTSCFRSREYTEAIRNSIRGMTVSCHDGASHFLPREKTL